MTQPGLDTIQGGEAPDSAIDPGPMADFPRTDRVGVLAADAAGKIVDFCAGANALLAGGNAGLLGRNLADIFPACAGRRQMPRPAQTVHCTATAIDGRRFPVTVTGFSTPGLCHVLSYYIVADLTDLSRQLAKLRMLTAAVDQTGDAVAVTDGSGMIGYVNSAFEKITGFSRAESVGRSMSILKSERHPPSFYEGLWGTLHAGKVFRARFANRRKDGRLFYEQKTISPIRDDAGRIISYVSTAKDVTDQVETEKRLDRLANYDSLTGLPNRNLFMDRIRHGVASAERTGKVLALLYLDLDRFKLINDTMGHAAGDELLMIAARRLRACVREIDTVSRLGGDEFTVILTDLASGSDTQRTVNAILSAFAEPFPLQTRQVYISPSIGISLYPENGGDASALLKQADLAMYHAKSAGRNGFAFFRPEMDDTARDNLTLETDLRGALERREFALEYQPQVDLVTGTIVAVEALLRWHHPERGAVPPVSFIPLLEEMGMMGPISKWVISTACTDIQKLSEAGGSDLQVAVNLSSGQFKDPHLIEQVGDVLRRTGLDPRRLEVEITEGTLMESVPQTVSTLESLARSGAQIAVDDFGTGYSSLAYLRRFSVDTIKIDRSFIWDTPRDEDATAIVKAIISLGRDLEMKVVAEGIETLEQFRFLQAQGCERAQGYLFSKPLSLGKLQVLMKEWTGMPGPCAVKPAIVRR